MVMASLGAEYIRSKMFAAVVSHLARSLIAHSASGAGSLSRRPFTNGCSVSGGGRGGGGGAVTVSGAVAGRTDLRAGVGKA